MPQALTLPRPNDRGHYVLACGSTIFMSLSHVYREGKPARPRYFVWVATKWAKEGNTERRVAVEGDILMCEEGIAFFDCPEQALRAITQARKGRQA